MFELTLTGQGVLTSCSTSISNEVGTTGERAVLVSTLATKADLMKTTSSTVAFNMEEEDNIFLAASLFLTEGHEMRCNRFETPSV